MKTHWADFMAAKPPFYEILSEDVVTHERKRVLIRSARVKNDELSFLRAVAKAHGYSYEEVEIDWDTEHNSEILISLKADGIDVSQWCLVSLNRLDA